MLQLSSGQVAERPSEEENEHWRYKVKLSFMILLLIWKDLVSMIVSEYSARISAYNKAK